LSQFFFLHFIKLNSILLYLSQPTLSFSFCKSLHLGSLNSVKGYESCCLKAGILSLAFVRSPILFLHFLFFFFLFVLFWDGVSLFQVNLEFGILSSGIKGVPHLPGFVFFDKQMTDIQCVQLPNVYMYIHTYVSQFLHCQILQVVFFKDQSARTF
jgi:hypothetical protein